MRNLIKRTAGLFALLFLAAAMTAGCARRPETTEDGRLKVVTTLFPYYDFVRQVAGDRVNLTLVVPAGMDSHSFEPTPADMITIQEADVLICNGGEMEHWLSQVLDSMDTSRMKIVTMMDYIDAVEEEHVEGMEEAEHGHAHGDEDDDGHGVEIEYDEHIWTSPVNAMAIVKIINSALDEVLPAQAGRFDENAQAYLAELKELDGQFRRVVAQGKRHMIIVADKFPFRYFADEYGLSYRAAFSGCSSDTEPSARTIAYLIDKVEDEQIPAVYYLELSSHSTARVIGEETGAKPLLLHSCHNVTRREFDQGITYLQLMKRNVEALREGLD